MHKLIKILHIDPSWKVIYILIREGALIKSAVSLEKALLLLAKQKFDLILSEPQNIAIIQPQIMKDEIATEKVPFLEKIQQIRMNMACCQTGCC
jgi:hypothetical protein